MLLKNGADVNKRVDLSPTLSGYLDPTYSNPGCSVLEIAAGFTPGGGMGEHGDIEMVTQFLDLKAEVNPPPSCRGPSTLTAACYRQDVNMVRLLLKHGASPDHSSGPSSLSIAAETGNLLVVIMLLAAGADVTRHREDNPLLAAARSGNLDIVSILLNFETTPYVVRVAISSADRLGHHKVAAYLRQHEKHQDTCIDTVQKLRQEMEALL
jgi:ankyrin repeat protein